MFQHCQPMRNHDTEQLQEENGKILLFIHAGILSRVCLHLVGQVPGGQVGGEEGAGGLVAVTELAALSAGEGDLVTPAPSPGGHNAGGGIFHPQLLDYPPSFLP